MLLNVQGKLCFRKQGTGSSLSDGDEESLAGERAGTLRTQSHLKAGHAAENLGRATRGLGGATPQNITVQRVQLVGLECTLLPSAKAQGWEITEKIHFGAVSCLISVKRIWPVQLL